MVNWSAANPDYKLIDHHSYPADRRHRERAFINLDASAELARQARAAEQAARAAGGHVVHRYHLETVANRIREFEAELRRIARRRQEHADREALLARSVCPELIAACALTQPHKCLGALDRRGAAGPTPWATSASATEPTPVRSGGRSRPRRRLRTPNTSARDGRCTRPGSS